MTLECLIRLFTSVYLSYSFDETRRTVAYDDIYDVGNLLTIAVHHSLALVIRRPDLGYLKADDNLKQMFQMFASESRVNQIVDINSLYLSEILMRDRRKDLERKVLMLNTIKIESHIFMKGFSFYLSELTFDVSEFLDFPDTKFCFEDLFEMKVFDQLIQMEVSPVTENDDFLDSIFFWEFYEGSIEPHEYQLLKFLMILRLYHRTIGMFRESIDVAKLSYKETTTKNLFMILPESMVKMAVLIIKTIKRNKFNSLVQKLVPLCPGFTAYFVQTLLLILLDMRKMCDETTFFSAIIHYVNKESINIDLTKIMTSTLVNKIEPQKLRYHKENLESIDNTVKNLREIMKNELNSDKDEKKDGKGGKEAAKEAKDSSKRKNSSNYAIHGYSQHR